MSERIREILQASQEVVGSEHDEKGRRRAEKLRSVQEDLAREMARALGRAQEKVRLAIGEAKAELDDLDRGQGDLATYRDAWRRAERARWELKVHREALGLRRHQQLEEDYPLPPRR